MKYSEARKLIQKVDVPEGQSGNYRISKFEVSDQEAKFFNLRQMISGRGAGGRNIESGAYTRLTANGLFDPIMSDTPAEMNDHIHPVMQSKDHCLIAGLGLGMVAEACLRNPDVDKVTVIELSEDVISLVEPHLSAKHGDRLEVIHSSIFDWKPNGHKFGMAWFDIWNDLCADNLPEMATLSRRFTRCCDWYGHWGREEIRRYA